MSGLYSNKFTIEINDVVRLVFVDERAPIKPGLPMASQTAAEIVMTRENFQALAAACARQAAKLQQPKE